MASAEKTYGTIVTNIGLQSIAAAATEGEQVNLIHLAVGDGGGEYYQPTPDMTGLRGQKWIGSVNNVSVNSDTPNMIDITAVIPSNAGGFTIREMAVLDDGDNMIAICNTPDTEKVIIESGAAGEIEVIMHIVVSNTDAISLLVNPNIATASKRELEIETSARRSADEALQNELNEHARNSKKIFFPDETPEGNNYIWYAPYTPGMEIVTPDDGSVVLEAVSYDGSDKRLHGEANKTDYTFDNTAVTAENGEIIVEIN